MTCGLSRRKIMPRLWLGWPNALFQRDWVMKLLILFQKNARAGRMNEAGGNAIFVMQRD